MTRRTQASYVSKRFFLRSVHPRCPALRHARFGSYISFTHASLRSANASVKPTHTHTLAVLPKSLPHYKPRTPRRLVFVQLPLLLPPHTLLRASSILSSTPHTVALLPKTLPHDKPYTGVIRFVTLLPTIHSPTMPSAPPLRLSTPHT